MFNQAGRLCGMKAPFHSQMCALLTEDRHQQPLGVSCSKRFLVLVFLPACPSHTDLHLEQLLRTVDSGSLSQAAARSLPLLNLCPLCSGLLFGTAPYPRCCSIREGLLISIIASSVWCCDSPAPPLPARPARSAGNFTDLLRCIMHFIIICLHRDFSVFSNNRYQGRMTPIISQRSSHTQYSLLSHRPHVTVDCRLALWITMKILTISKLIATLSCFYFWSTCTPTNNSWFIGSTFFIFFTTCVFCMQHVNACTVADLWLSDFSPC